MTFLKNFVILILTKEKKGGNRIMKIVIETALDILVYLMCFNIILVLIGLGINTIKEIYWDIQEKKEGAER